LAEEHNQSKSSMNTKDKTAKPIKGAKASEPLEDSVSGLDVRQLLGLGRAEPDPVSNPEAVEITLPASNAPISQAREAQPDTVKPETQTEPENTASIQREEKPDNQDVTHENSRQSTPDPVTPPVVEQRQNPTAPPQRPSRPAFDTRDIKPGAAETKPEPSMDTSAQSRLGPNFSGIAVSGNRPIPPVTAPSELSSLRPSIDPLAANASLSATRSSGENAPVTPASQAPDPSIAANAKLEELASLSERTLEDYETFDDFDDGTHQQSKKTPIIILASLLCVGVLAGGVVFAYRQGVKESFQTELPVIVAATSAAKEEPSSPGGVKIPHQNKLIYDRVLGEETDIAEKIVPREEKVVSFSDRPAHTTLSKTLPTKKTIVPPIPAAPAKPLIKAIPVPANAVKKVVEDEVAKKLAEVIPPKPVSPPGKLINESGIVPAVAIPEAGTTAANALAEATRPITETLKLPPKNVAPEPVKKVGEIVRLETENITDTPAPVPEIKTTTEPSAEKLAIIKLVEDSVAENTTPAVSAKVPAVIPRRKPPPPSTRVASASVPTTSAPTTSTRASVGGYVIQIAAFRSQEEALSRYALLKRRHSSLLRPYTSFVQRADLGDRGVYYRLRLGPIDGKDRASTLCRSLLSAGEKDCLVRSR